jgi:hypothetical protein
MLRLQPPLPTPQLPLWGMPQGLWWLCGGHSPQIRPIARSQCWFSRQAARGAVPEGGSREGRGSLGVSSCCAPAPLLFAAITALWAAVLLCKPPKDTCAAHTRVTQAWLGTPSCGPPYLSPRSHRGQVCARSSRIPTSHVVESSGQMLLLPVVEARLLLQSLTPTFRSRSCMVCMVCICSLYTLTNNELRECSKLSIF